MSQVATYTTVADLDLDRIAELYALTGLELEPLDGGAANSSFRATADQGAFVLTVLDNLVIRPTGGLAILDWETVSLDSALLDLGMTLLGLANTGGRLDRDRAARIVDGYTKARPLDQEELDALPAQIEHAALIIAFHRYYRHNVRFPNPAKSDIHTEMIGFVESLGGLVL